MQRYISLPALCLCLALVAALNSCGTALPDQIEVAVTTMPPSSATSLTVKATLNGKADMTDFTETDPTHLGRFVVVLPITTTGTLALTLTFFDTDGCTIATGQAMTTVSSPLSVQVELPVTVTALASPMCPPPTAPPTTACGEGVFCWTFPNPQGNPLRGMFALSATDIWAVGDAGTVMHNDGNAWSMVPSGVSADLYGVWVGSTGGVFIVGQGGTILHWDNKTLSAQTSGIKTDLHGVWGSSSHDVYAVGDQGTVLHYDGTTWGAPKTITNNISLRAIWGAAANQIYAVGDSGTISSCDGMNWTKMTVPAAATSTNFLGIAGSGTTVFAVGAGGTILSLSGTTWSTVQNTMTTNQLNAIWSNGPNDFYAVGNAGTRLHYTGSWVSIGDTVMSNLYAVSGVSGNVWAAGDLGQLLQDQGGGTTWTSATQQVATTVPNFRSMYGFSPMDIWAVGDSGAIFHYDGTHWSQPQNSASITTQTLNDVWGLGSADVWAVGNSKTILHWNGTQWQSHALPTNPTTPKINNVYGVGGVTGNIWITGDSTDANNVQLMNFMNFGDAGIDYELNLGIGPQTMYSVWGVSSTETWLGGVGNFVHIVFSGGTYMLMPISVSGNVKSFWGSSASSIWAVGDGGLLENWNGTAWSPVTSGTTANLTQISGTSLSSIAAVGSMGTFLQYDGTSWKATNSGTHIDLGGVYSASASATGTFAGGVSGTLLVSH